MLYNLMSNLYFVVVVFFIVCGVYMVDGVMMAACWEICVSLP